MTIQLLYHKLVESRHVAIIWLVGTLLFAYLSIPFFKKDSGMYLVDLLEPSKKSFLPSKKATELKTDNATNEALLFVTINKKQFLTKFVTYISNEDLAAKEFTDSSTGSINKSFIIVGRRTIKKTPKPKEDFFIRAAPKI